MTAPGVDRITALTISPPAIIPAALGDRAVGAYLGLTTRRYAFGEIDWSGRIAKYGDAMLGSYLHDADDALLTRIVRWKWPQQPIPI
jgi:transposase